MNPMRATIAILMALLIQPVSPQETAESKFFTVTKQRAEQGNVYAQYNLGVMYYQGERAPQNYQAAEQGYAAAQFNLGVMYAMGEGVPEYFVQAHMWSNLAASQLTGEEREKCVELRIC